MSLFTHESAGVEEKIELFSVGLLSWGREQAETWWSVLRESVVGGGSERSTLRSFCVDGGSVWAFGRFSESAELRFQ